MPRGIPLTQREIDQRKLDKASKEIDKELRDTMKRLGVKLKPKK